MHLLLKCAGSVCSMQICLDTHCPCRGVALFYLAIIFHSPKHSLHTFARLSNMPAACANTSKRSAGSRVWFLGPFSGFDCASDRPFVIERQVSSLSTKQQMSTTLHYTITVCCNRTAHSQHCLLAIIIRKVAKYVFYTISYRRLFVSKTYWERAKFFAKNCLRI